MKSDAILEKIREKLKEVNPEKRTLTKVYQYKFRDNDGNLIKEVVMDLKSLEIYEGKVENPDCEISISDDDFYLVGSKQVPFQEIINQGKAEIKGDLEAFNAMVEKFKFYAKH